MLDLEKDAAMHWLAERLPSELHAAELIRPVEDVPEVRPGFVALGTALHASRARDGAASAERVRTDPVRDELRGVLAQLGSARLLRILDWLTESADPVRRHVLDAVLEPDPSGAGQALQSLIRDYHRQALLGHIFAPERLDALLAACRATPKEVS